MTEKAVNLVLMGFGNVGKAFVKLLEEKTDHLRESHGLSLFLRAIFKSTGGLFPCAGFKLKDILDDPGADLRVHAFWKQNLSLESIVREVEPGVLVDCTPSNLKTGEPGLTHARLALDSGWHVVTANKGPLAVNFSGLREKASRNRLALKFSGAAAAALPALDVGLCSLAGAEVLAVEGILNGTTNFILTEMGEGRSYSEAVQEARVRGIAEPDPASDVEGWDTAVKLLLIGNAVMGLNLRLSDISVEGIVGLPAELIDRARREGKSVKLLGRIRREQGGITASVAPCVIDHSHPLFGVEGTAKGITYFTDTMGDVTLTGGKSDPRGAAAAVLKDIINIYHP
ncbi:MAG: homoserine dehydrogenase [Clostridiales bacterium]|nr:homoserine dehydrogenase [Clostridiales bacterium]